MKVSNKAKLGLGFLTGLGLLGSVALASDIDLNRKMSPPVATPTICMPNSGYIYFFDSKGRDMCRDSSGTQYLVKQVGSVYGDSWNDMGKSKDGNQGTNAYALNSKLFENKIMQKHDFLYGRFNVVTTSDTSDYILMGPPKVTINYSDAGAGQLEAAITNAYDNGASYNLLPSQPTPGWSNYFTDPSIVFWSDFPEFKYIGGNQREEVHVRSVDSTITSRVGQHNAWELGNMLIPVLAYAVNETPRPVANNYEFTMTPSITRGPVNISYIGGKPFNGKVDVFNAAGREMGEVSVANGKANFHDYNGLIFVRPVNGGNTKKLVVQ